MKNVFISAEDLKTLDCAPLEIRKGDKPMFNILPTGNGWTKETLESAIKSVTIPGVEAMLMERLVGHS